MWNAPPRHTLFESLVETSPLPGFGLESEIATHFDPNAGLLYERRDFAFSRPVELVTGLPDEEWVASRLADLVRDEFAGASGSAPPPEEPVFNKPVFIDPAEAAYEYLEACESQLVFGGPALEIARAEGDVTRALYVILTHHGLGNSLNSKNVSYESFRELVGPKVDAQERLLFIFPGFPFKDQNPFRTVNRPEEHDLAEVALLIRLHILATAIFQVYPMGADWIILSDGLAFSRALRVSEQSILEYRRRLVAARNQLDIGRAVSILDYAGLAKFVDSPLGYWTEVATAIEEILRTSGDIAVRHALETLAVGMRRNVDLTDVRKGISWSSWWLVLQSADPRVLPNGELREVASEVSDICLESAILYAAFNLAAKYVKLDSQVFPGAIRATIHAKRGQIAVPRIGGEFPWNGMAVLDGAKINPTSLSCKPLRELAGRGRRLTPFVDESGRTLFVSLGDAVNQ